MKKKRDDFDQDEEALERMERENGIEDKPAKRHPHEKRTPVGEDERTYLEEELEEQGYREDGLGTSEDEEEEAGPHEQGRVL